MPVVAVTQGCHVDLRLLLKDAHDIPAAVSSPDDAEPDTVVCPKDRIPVGS